MRHLHWCLSTTGLLSRHQPQPGRAQRTMADSETTPKLLLPKVVSCSRRMLTLSHWVHSCVHSISESREDTLCDIPYTILHHLTASYTILHLHRPKMPKSAPQLHQTSTVWEERDRSLPIKAPLPGRGFWSSRLTIWLVAKAWQWHAMTTQIYGVKFCCQWTRKISQKHAKSAFVCFQW